MIDRARLVTDLKKLTADLVEDLRARSEGVPEVRAIVEGQYREAHQAGRTDRSLEEWREDLLAQVAVGWVLASVFVRFCEDNRLFDPPLLSGPGERRGLAGDHRADWLASHQALGDREWLEHVFGRYRAVPATAEIFGIRNPLWQFGPTADGAKQILELWQSVDHETGRLLHDFTDPALDTRFLGDLYQELSEHAKKMYALLQTPDFVEAFILDRTLDPALETFGLDGFRMIDPTCGSGHFLLGAFDRILDRWQRREPGTPVRELVQRTLDSVCGVDINAFAVEIARFRLLVAVLKVSRIGALMDTPAFRMRLAVGDSLLHGKRAEDLLPGTEGMSPLLRHRYALEDEELANRVLEASQYHAVVGNPPYITVKEPAMRGAYRDRYESASGTYSLGVPFTERFFDLAVTPRAAEAGGYVGMITTNTFMKRSFGRKLVEQFLPTVDLTTVVDTSGVYIPGHGTPTVILEGRHQAPVSNTIRTVLGIRGEPGRPSDPARGLVWSSILALIDRPGSEDDYVSVEDIDRDRLAKHPWSLQGGAAPSVLQAVTDGGTTRLDALSTSIGFASFPGLDDAFVAPTTPFRRRGVDREIVHPFVRGEYVRDWTVAPTEAALVPLDSHHRPRSLDSDAGWYRWLWPNRVRLASIKSFGGKTRRQLGEPWWTWYRWVGHKYDTPLSITFAEVATHNHFVLDRGGKVFKQTAPVIKLAEDATEDDHLRLLGLLNSSTACFWMKQVCHAKGQGGVGQEGRAEWEEWMQISGTPLGMFPIPPTAPPDRARHLDHLASELTVTLPSAVLARCPPTRATLSEARERAESLRAQMVAAQEELDWACYAHYGLTDQVPPLPVQHLPELARGERAFEIVLARAMAAGDVESTWFERHGSTPITELPAHWPGEYRALVERRMALIGSERAIRLLERPEYKRRWNWESWDELETSALREWLLDRMEAEHLWSEPKLTTTARLADRLRRQPDFVEAAQLYAGRVDLDLAGLVTELALDEAVPHAAGYRYRPSGLRKRRTWEDTWRRQREEDQVDARRELPEDHPEHLSEAQAEALKKERALDRIPVPPKYKSSDFTSTTVWRMRGKLDVPKERFIRYPDTGFGADSTPVIGWAGWDQLGQARALAGHYHARKQEGAAAPELVGLLAGLQELVPWLLQWHNDLDPEFGQRMGDFFASFVSTEARGHGLTVDDLIRWTPT